MSIEIANPPMDVATELAAAWSGGDEDGIVVVGAAGNYWYGSGNPGVSYPAKYSEVIAVSGSCPT
jgi:hypothetical protein